MVTKYINSSGKETIIAEMQDSHLVNSYLHYKKRLTDLIDKSNAQNVGFMVGYVKDLQILVKSLKWEVKKRNLFSENIT